MNGRRSLFGPLLLIAAGVILLLIQIGYIPAENLWVMANLWPLLLIFAGVGLILRGSWPLAWDVLTLLFVIVLFLAVAFAPQIGLSTTPWFGAHPSFLIGVPATGEVIREDRAVSGFDSVVIEYPADVTITYGSQESLSIQAQSDILPEIRTEVRNGVLYLTTPRGRIGLHRPRNKPVRIEVTVPDLAYVGFSSAGRVNIRDFNLASLSVSASGAGEVGMVNLTAQRLDLDLSGAGNLSVGGPSAAGALKLTISGVGSFDGEDLQSGTADVSISGAGSATVWVTRQLTAQISGLGSVRYYGSPNVSKRVSGLGGVVSLGNK